MKNLIKLYKNRIKVLEHQIAVESQLDADAIDMGYSVKENKKIQEHNAEIEKLNALIADAKLAAKGKV